MIAYEDLATGKRAMKTYDYMAEQLGSECIFTNQMWKFDVLGVPKLREMAAKDAAAAEIIIVSAHEGKPLPPEVTAWIDLWLSYETRASAIVGLFTGESSHTPARNYLADVAKRAKIEFFSQPGLWPGMAEAKHGWGRDEKAFTFLAGTMPETPSASHWGINE